LELVNAALELALSAGVPRIFVFTESADNLFARCGFVMLDRTELQGAPISILTKSLSAPNQ
jgi:N-acetylglutamate synthase-like GNAT family acetyltransferase